jgi:hypothetical protein
VETLHECEAKNRFSEPRLRPHILADFIVSLRPLPTRHTGLNVFGFRTATGAAQHQVHGKRDSVNKNGLTLLPLFRFALS